MEPRLQAIMEANARLLRFSAEDVTPPHPHHAAALRALQADLDEQCRRVLTDLVPVAGPAAAGMTAASPETPTLASTAAAAPNPSSCAGVALFLRYLLRNMDLAERIAMLETAREADTFLARLRGSEATPGSAARPRSHLPAVLEMLGGSAEGMSL